LDVRVVLPTPPFSLIIEIIIVTHLLIFLY
jgi:hypothetical protein